MKRTAHIAGCLLHVSVLGTLLFLAVVKLAATQSGVLVFRYQGF
jgi:hypothetical protein